MSDVNDGNDGSDEVTDEMRRHPSYNWNQAYYLKVVDPGTGLKVTPDPGLKVESTPNTEWDTGRGTRRPRRPTHPDDATTILVSKRDTRPTAAMATVSLDEYLVNLHATTWGEGFSITDPKRRDEAIDWFMHVATSIGMVRPGRPQ